MPDEKGIKRGLHPFGCAEGRGKWEEVKQRLAGCATSFWLKIGQVGSFLVTFGHYSVRVNKMLRRLC